jgi:hypothetical protein
MTDRILYPQEAAVSLADKESIAKAILGAYPNKDLLYLRLANKWGVRIEDDITNLGHPGKVIIQRLVDHAQAEGRLLDLLGLAWSDRPGNPALKALADMWIGDQAGVLAKYAEAPVVSLAGGGGGGGALAAQPARLSLQREVATRSRLVRLPRFIEEMERLSEALCRVCIPEVNGTGFLIGHRHVLTNYHVVDPAIKASRRGEDISFEFDYDGQTTPVVRRARPGPNWLIARSPHSQSDLDGFGEPSPGELDFALVSLEAEVEPDRLALALPCAPPIVAMNDFVVIGQHPKGQAAQVAFGQVVEIPGAGFRYRYDVTTFSGSSGSPVLDMDLSLVALHHAANPDAQPRYNQGVPITRIKQALTEAGIDLDAL